MDSLQSVFSNFSLLPAEIQLQIWDSAAPVEPSMHMHMFDVRAPAPTPAPAPLPLPTSAAIASHKRTASHRRSRSRCSSSGKVRKPSASPPRRTFSSSSLSLSHQQSEQQQEGLTLQPFDTSPLATTNTSLPGARFSADPSMYKFRQRLAATCTDARRAVHHSQAAIPEADRGLVELGVGVVPYNNATDVLHLRFVQQQQQRASTSSPPPPPPSADAMDIDTDTETDKMDTKQSLPSKTSTAPLSTIFQSLWSRELATTLHRARRIAIDVSQIWPELAEQQHKLVQDIVFLVCTLQNDLEVLYLVDYSAGPGRYHPQRKAEAMMQKEGSELYRALHGHLLVGNSQQQTSSAAKESNYNGAGAPAAAAAAATVDMEAWEREMQRQGDVIQGVGKVWREVFDLEKLGWHARHPAFVFGEMFSEVVRLQQGNWFGEGQKQAVFKGVRVLVAQDE